jgi:hypothetical protein
MVATPTPMRRRSDPELSACSSCLSPRGLGLVPQGTRAPRLSVAPAWLSSLASAVGLSFYLLHVVLPTESHAEFGKGTSPTGDPAAVVPLERWRGLTHFAGDGALHLGVWRTLVWLSAVLATGLALAAWG